MPGMPSPLEYLEVLAREAAPVEFERPLVAARPAVDRTRRHLDGAS